MLWKSGRTCNEQVALSNALLWRHLANNPDLFKTVGGADIGLRCFRSGKRHGGQNHDVESEPNGRILAIEILLNPPACRSILRWGNLS